jgi:hypothetical protein
MAVSLRIWVSSVAKLLAGDRLSVIREVLAPRPTASLAALIHTIGKASFQWAQQKKRFKIRSLTVVQLRINRHSSG